MRFFFSLCFFSNKTEFGEREMENVCIRKPVEVLSGSCVRYYDYSPIRNDCDSQLGDGLYRYYEEDEVKQKNTL